MAAPFPPLGPPRRVPQLRRYYGAVRLPVPLSPRLVAFAWRYPASRLSIRSQRPRTPDRGPGVHAPVPTPGKMRREASRASQVPGQPAVPMPCSSTPAGPNTPGHCGMSAWPPLCPQQRLPQNSPFGAPSHGLGTRCLRLVRRGYPPPTQNSLPAAGQALPDGIGYPQGPDERFQTCVLRIIPLSQALPGARTLRMCESRSGPFSPSAGGTCAGTSSPPTGR